MEAAEDFSFPELMAELQEAKASRALLEGDGTKKINKARQIVADRRVASVYSVGEPPAKVKLRVMKVASTQSAAPGEEVDFTIRFDNVGNQAIGNVTVIRLPENRGKGAAVATGMVAATGAVRPAAPSARISPGWAG